MPTTRSRTRPTPELRALPDGAEREFFGAVRRAFHQDLVEEHVPHYQEWFENDRSFGFTADGRWVSSCGAFSQQLVVPGGQMAAGAVTIVTVAPDWRRRGLLTAMMDHQLADIADRGEPVAVLWAAEVPIYGRFGYGNATRRLQLSGATRATAYKPQIEVADGWVEEVDATQFLDLVPDVHARTLPDRPGALTRDERWWKRLMYDPADSRGGASALRHVVHRGAGGLVDGYALYRVVEGWGAGDTPDAELRVEQLDAVSGPARAALWRHLLDLDLVRRFSMSDASVAEPLLHQVADQRAVRAQLCDALYLRVIDVPAALTARRYAADLDVVIGLRDTQLPANDRAFRLQIEGGAASVTRSRRRPDLAMDIRELGAIYLGGVPLTELADAGLVTERTAGSVIATSTAFGWHRQPFCPDHF